MSMSGTDIPVCGSRQRACDVSVSESPAGMPVSRISGTDIPVCFIGAWGLLAQAWRADLRREDANVPVASIRAMKEIVSTAVVSRRFQMELTTLFSAVALVLGMVGVYGFVSYAVMCRTHEIGLRLALGATPSDIMRTVCASGLKRSRLDLDSTPR